MAWSHRIRGRVANLLRETPVAGPARAARDAADGFRSHLLSPRFRRRRRGAALILYHGVEPRVRDPLVEGMHTSARLFRAQLRHLKRHYRIMELAEVLDRLEAGREVPGHWAVLTFDDGYRNNLTCAREIAREEGGVPMSVFVVTDFVGTKETFWTTRYLMALLHGRGDYLRVPAPDGTLRKASTRTRRERAILHRETLPILKGLPRPDQSKVLEEFFAQFGDGEVEEIRDAFSSFDWLRWDDVRELAADGVDVGSHTRTHAYMREELGEGRLREEILGSRDALTVALGSAPPHFAYPNGSTDDFCETSGRLLREAGYRCGITTVHGTVVPGADPYTLHRIPWCANHMPRFRLANAAGCRV